MRRLILLLTLMAMSALVAHAQTQAESCSQPAAEPQSMYVGTYPVSVLFPLALDGDLSIPKEIRDGKKPARGKKQTSRRKSSGRKQSRGGGSDRQPGLQKGGGLGGDNKAIVNVQVCVWRKLNGKIHVIQNIETLTVSDSCTIVDTMSTAAIVAILSRASIVQGIQLGLIPCTGPCITADTVSVSQSVCVMRTGSGPSTHMVACGSTPNCSRDYTFCCPTPSAAALIVQQISPAPMPCTGPCQATCQ